jgi:hypothetical protein
MAGGSNARTSEKRLGTRPRGFEVDGGLCSAPMVGRQFLGIRRHLPPAVIACRERRPSQNRDRHIHMTLRNAASTVLCVGLVVDAQPLR